MCPTSREKAELDGRLGGVSLKSRGREDFYISTVHVNSEQDDACVTI